MPTTKKQMEWNKANTKTYTVSILNSTGIPDAIAECIEEKNTTRSHLITEAIREKLIREGYNPEDYKPSGNYPVSGKIIK